ncbi:MAG: ATP synthase F1 subunit gamma, partial [Firmicutes bacterium]|nr:ATP synthase F1 subunit gamma [Bacillota bacterium]
MAGKAEIKLRMGSIAETKKVTDAMYMTSSVKMRRAKSEVEKTTPYFGGLRAEIGALLHYLPEGVTNRYFRNVDPESKEPSALIVVTADKGLAGSYNQTILREAENQLATGDNLRLFLIGTYGRRYFEGKDAPVVTEFRYTADAPNVRKARRICMDLLARYDRDEIGEIDILYTGYKAGRTGAFRLECLIPLDKSDFPFDESEGESFEREFYPDPNTVLEEIIPSYVTGYLYGALVDSYCSEQEARMTAMKSAGENAEEILEALRKQYNSMRQTEITRELTEISSGAKALKRKQGDGGKERKTKMTGTAADKDPNGKIAGVSGPVVDVVFAGRGKTLPKIREKLTVAVNGEERVMEVAQHIGDGICRCILLGSSDGLARGMTVVPAGCPIAV